MSTFRACRVRHRRSAGLAAWALLGLSAITLPLCGCGSQGFSATLDEGFKRLFTGQRTPQQYMLVAVSSEDPDTRREAVAKIADSKQYDREWAIKGFIAIALLESDSQTRCVAIRALARTGDPRATETALKILNHGDHPPQEVWPPTALCRWDATEALATLSGGGFVPDKHREQVFTTLVDRLRLDSDRHARIAAAHGLATYPRRASIEALIGGLQDKDFAVAHECENSLVQLTGRTNNLDPVTWKAWLDTNREQLFAHAGEIPTSRQLPYKNRWQKTWYETKDLVEFLWPGPKEE